MIDQFFPQTLPLPWAVVAKAANGQVLASRCCNMRKIQ